MSSSNALTLSLCASISLLMGVSALLSPPEAHQQAQVDAQATKKIAELPAKLAAQRMDLSKAMNVNWPATSRDLEAAAFATPDAERGGVWRLPGGRPIAEPAYEDRRG